MQIERLNSNALVVNALPDGSKILVDLRKETLFALNPTAGAVWDACSSPATLQEVAAKIRASEDVAEEAVLELQAKHLVAITGPSRSAWTPAAAPTAVPLVLSLTMTEQKACAIHGNWTQNGAGGLA
jgi:hypothetical protein